MTEQIQCAQYKKCGACQLQNLPYERQLRLKQGKIIQLLGKFAHVDPILGMDRPYHYRNKVQAAFFSKGGKILSGVYQSSSHQIVPVESCLIEDELADAVIVTIRKLLKSFRLKVYNEETQTGFLRHVLVRRSFSTGELMVVLVTGTAEFPDAEKFVNALRSRHPKITTVVQNVNRKHVNLILGEQSRVLYGSGFVEDELLGCRFRVSPKAFYQVNPVQTAVLYGKALELARLTGKETVLDAYCGTGTIGILASKQAKRVIGVEINADAVADARVNAARNGIENIYFHEADAGKYMAELAGKHEKPDVVIMDPPRAGASLDFLKALCILNPKTIIYISCNPETQARDLNYLTHKGYAVKRLQPVDMFPHTSHIECVACLVRERSETLVGVRIGARPSKNKK